MKIITKKKEEKILKEETYSLDYTLVKWLNKHLKAYYDYANKIIDMSYHEYKYNGKNYTLEQIVKRLIDITGMLSNEDYYFGEDGKKLVELKDEMYDLLKLVHFGLWW